MLRTAKDIQLLARKRLLLQKVIFYRTAMHTLCVLVRYYTKKSKLRNDILKVGEEYTVLPATKSIKKVILVTLILEWD